MFSAAPLFFAFLAGFLPGVIWLSFWLFEDRCQPEPKRYIFFTFLAGMLAVPLVIPIEQYAQQFLSGVAMYGAWAAAEELMKFGGAYLVALRSSAFDEPLDAVVYMVTVALGFAVLENAMFLFPSISHGDFLKAFTAGDLRFVGAMLLHTLTSGIIGVSIALAWRKPAATRRLAALCGVILAIALHTLFNFSILEQSESVLLYIFLLVWVGIVALLLLVERIKIPEKDYC